MNRLPNMLAVMALKAEGQGLFEQAGIALLYTGVGKVNGAISLTRRLSEYRRVNQPLPLVVNLGSAGSHCFAPGTLVGCTKFVQRDMDASALGFEIGETPFENTPSMLVFSEFFPAFPTAVCGTGDSFQTNSSEHWQVVDMEAYALAKACWLEGAQFACLKYITDNADGAAPENWKFNLNAAAIALFRSYIELQTKQQEFA